MAGVVHHVQHDAGHGEVLNDRAAVGPVAAGLRGEGHRVAQDPQHLVIGGHGPEALPVGCVGGGLVPPHRRLLAVQPEDVVWEAVGEDVEVGQVDLPECLDHRAILVAVPDSVKNGARGGVAQLAEAGRLNRPQ